MEEERRSFPTAKLQVAAALYQLIYGQNISCTAILQGGFLEKESMGVENVPFSLRARSWEFSSLTFVWL